MLRRILSNLIYGLFYISGLWLLFRYINRGRMPILMYHGVIENDICLWTQLPVKKFKRQMEYLVKRYRPVDLSTAVEYLKDESNSAEYPVVITFDDGFANNKSNAYEFLKEYGLPATIFLTTSFVNKEAKYQGLIWTDYVLGLFRNTENDSIDLRDLGLWKFDLATQQRRIDAGYRVCAALKLSAALRGNGTIGKIAERLGANFRKEELETFRSLSWDDVRQIDCEGLISFGAHTVNHEILSKIPHEAMVNEIMESKSAIEKQVGRTIRYFAYPNGRPEDFNADVKETVSRCFECALTTIDGLNSAGDDLFTLKRIGVGNDLQLWKFKLELAGVGEFIGRFKGPFFDYINRVRGIWIL